MEKVTKRLQKMQEKAALYFNRNGNIYRYVIKIAENL